MSWAIMVKTSLSYIKLSASSYCDEAGPEIFNLLWKKQCRINSHDTIFLSTNCFNRELLLLNCSFSSITSCYYLKRAI